MLPHSLGALTPRCAVASTMRRAGRQRIPSRGLSATRFAGFHQKIRMHCSSAEPPIARLAIYLLRLRRSGLRPQITL
jgi:hypothetical protein